ncbi:MAG: hypothetical protein COY40_02320 [Alphaproteobacteria bacterium CG_4_10_14_0_8_um_filter_53_9]|nr:MAG: hypothetical protein COY40_02320 [Alphaproteobacteria bacterium CG_4_10_14_0_8_um_filter_53_9]
MGMSNVLFDTPPMLSVWFTPQGEGLIPYTLEVSTTGIFQSTSKEVVAVADDEGRPLPSFEVPDKEPKPRVEVRKGFYVMSSELMDDGQTRFGLFRVLKPPKPPLKIVRKDNIFSLVEVEELALFFLDSQSLPDEPPAAVIKHALTAMYEAVRREYNHLFSPKPGTGKKGGWFSRGEPPELYRLSSREDGRVFVATA